MITVRDMFPDFDEFDVFIAEEPVRKIYSLTDPNTIWETWPGKKTDVYFWGVFENGVSFGVDSKGMHCLFVKS